MGFPRPGKIVATIECRMTSSRLPGKVLLEAIDGKSMLEIMIDRVKQVKKIDQIILATTVSRADDPLEKFADRLGVLCFRGSEEDVLLRVIGAARKFSGDIVVELTGDCPLIDPELIAQAIDVYLHNDCDYVSNCEPLSYPIGMETQVFSLKQLERAGEEGKTPEDREHVSWYIRRHPDLFRHLTIMAPPSLNRPDIALTLDEKSDSDLIRIVLQRLYKKQQYFGCDQIVRLFDQEPELLNINARVMRKDVVL